MVDLYNSTGIIGQIITSGNNYLTGSETFTLLIILVIFLVFALLFRIPVIYVMLLLTPLIILLMAFNTAFLIFGGIFILILTQDNKLILQQPR